MLIIWILSSIIIFSIIVLIHEYGHFKSARIFGVKVEEFGLGIPPRAKKLFTDKKWTLFSLNWLPLWGFVKLAWEHPNSFLLYDKNRKKFSNDDLARAIRTKEDIFDKEGKIIDSETLNVVYERLEENNADYNLNNKPAWQQSIIILAGVFMNFMLAILIFSVLFFIWVKPIWINTHLQTDRELMLIPTPEEAIEIWLIEERPWVRLQPIEESIASKSWLEENDIVLSINWEELENAELFIDTIQANPWQELIFEVHRAQFCPECLGWAKCKPCVWDGSFNLAIVPSSDGKIGAYIGNNININEEFKYKFGVLWSIKHWVKETYNQTLLTFEAIGTLLRKIIRPETKTERKEAIQQVSGPIGIVDFITSVLSNGFVFLVIIWAVISINLAVFNLLPIPALDGGRFLFIVVNAIILKIFGKKAINHQTESIIHVWSFIFLILLSILIAYNDILKIIWD